MKSHGPPPSHQSPSSYNHSCREGQVGPSSWLCHSWRVEDCQNLGPDILARVATVIKGCLNSNTFSILHHRWHTDYIAAAVAAALGLVQTVCLHRFLRLHCPVRCPLSPSALRCHAGCCQGRSSNHLHGSVSVWGSRWCKEEPRFSAFCPLAKTWMAGGSTRWLVGLPVD